MANNTLFKNTAFLYLLTFSNYLFGLITIPYETRVLGPEAFGILGFAASFYTYFYVILDFGFILLGTKLIAENINDKQKLSFIVISITYAKLLILIVLLLLFIIIGLNVPYLKAHIFTILLYLIQAGIIALVPDYLYRGIENMKMITMRTILVRFVFVCLIFVFLKRPDQYNLVPIFNIIGVSVALIWIIYDMYCNVGLRPQVIMINDVLKILKRAFPFFISRVAATIYSASNTIILGFIYPKGGMLGLYTSADKVRNLASQAASPIADSFYPYMLRTKDYRKMFRISVFLEVLILIACAVLWVYSEEFCIIVFGDQFRDAAIILRHMIPLMAVVLPSYILGFPALTPIGKVRWANRSVEIALMHQVLGVILLFAFDNVTAITLINLTFASECISIIVRVIAFISGVRKV